MKGQSKEETDQSSEVRKEREEEKKRRKRSGRKGKKKKKKPAEEGTGVTDCSRGPSGTYRQVGKETAAH